MSQSHEELELAVDAAPARKSGRAVFDEGRTVWEWQTATGVFERYVSDAQLSRLEAANLQLAEQPDMNQGFAIYGSRRAASKLSKTEREFPARRAAVPVRSPAPEAVSALRQLWRRLMPSS